MPSCGIMPRMERKRLLLGIDYGTGGCKTTVLDETGRFVGEASTEIASSMHECDVQRGL